MFSMSSKNIILSLVQCLIMVLGLIQYLTLSAEVVIYSVPNEVRSGNKYINRSKEYKVEIVQFIEPEKSIESAIEKIRKQLKKT